MFTLRALFLAIPLLLCRCSHKSTSLTESSPPAQPLNPYKTTCTQNNDIRQIEIRSYQKEGCDLFYTKFKTEKSIAKATSEKKYCEEISKKIITNLTSSGFRCE